MPRNAHSTHDPSKRRPVTKPRQHKGKKASGEDAGPRLPTAAERLGWPLPWRLGAIVAIVGGSWLAAADAQQARAPTRWQIPAPTAAAPAIPARAAGDNADPNADPADPQPAPMPPMTVDDLQAEIVAPDTAAAGALVRLQAVAPNAQSLRWLLPGQPPELWAASETGAAAFFASPTPGRYTFALVAAATINGRAEQVSAEHTLTITGPPPGPAPGPSPGPNPGPAPGPSPTPTPAEPTFAPGRYGLAAEVYRATAGLVGPAAPNAKRAAEILRGLAGNYNAIKSQAAAGVISSPEAMTSKTRERNRETAGADAPLVAEALGTVKTCLDRLAASKTEPTLKTLADYQAAWGEIAEGLGVAGARGPQ
jgi:hypothetical protein